MSVSQIIVDDHTPVGYIVITLCVLFEKMLFGEIEPKK
jgi:hypothetical protein